jgi:hypothetical protein
MAFTRFPWRAQVHATRPASHIGEQQSLRQIECGVAPESFQLGKFCDCGSNNFVPPLGERRHRI